MKDLPRRLRDLGYEERALNDLLDLHELYTLRDGISARTVVRAQQDTPLAHLGAFFFLRQTRDRALLEKLLGAEAVAEMLELGLVAATPEGLLAKAHLFPCVGRFIFTDLFWGSGSDEMHQVYWLGGDSLGLARLAPRKRVKASLDLCTGSGVHAVLAGAHAGKAYGVDINPRALYISRINARLNGVEAEFLEGSLYQPVPRGKKFGLITANPPFVPTPKKDLALFRPGGETGEDITEAIVRGLKDRLEVGGTMALVSQVPVLRGSHVLDRVESWVGGARGWGLAYLNLGPLDRDDMIAGHIETRMQFMGRLGNKEGEQAYRREFELWLDSYSGVGIERMELAMTYVRRLRPDHPGWRAEWQTSFPRGSMSAWVERWLDAQDRFAEPLDEGWKPTPAYQRLMLDVRNGEGFVFRDPIAAQSIVPRESAQLLQLADGRKTARQLLKETRQPEELLKDLGRQLLLT